MRVAVVGLGAIGGLLAAQLAQAGQAVSVLARGATLAAVRAHGLRLTRGSHTATVALAGMHAPAGSQLDAPRGRLLQASDNAAELGLHDLVIITVKGPSLPPLAARLAPLIGPQTVVLPAMNGVPWWFLQAWRERPAGMPASLASVDPQGRVAAALPLPQVLGAVVHMAASCPAPGEVLHTLGERLIIGEPSGGLSERTARVAAVLREAGFGVEESSHIRRDLWFKLWGNMTMNPVSALTGATCDRILDDPLVRQFCLRAMAEAATVGERVGCPIDQSGDERMDVTRRLGAFKTSMLQDCEAGRPLELGALVAAVVEVARAVGVPTPNTDALLGLTRLMAATRGL
jgi:2-dehydropantoate 2-reductase